ncbi:Pollen Ole e 1 allergen/extensin [Macleaya cordata]|uniref:Pollen Ole e 1 allergen/extensin n=1 Tax=Macleaya cordata TaxID=56857 RepID=A0A200R5B2_MACCD|nr:Pollen Ole e 1 allergen/extensin [Macleaya cordata]
MRMPMVIVMAAVAASLLLACMNVSEAREEPKGPKVIHVGGKVLCQDCSNGWYEWVHEGKPIKGCRVSVTCMDEHDRVIYYGSDETDEEGEFEMIIDKYTSKGKELKTELCKTRLVSSPDPACNVPTDFAGGQSGVELFNPSVNYRDLTKYNLGPFYFTSPMCVEPDTTYSSSDDQGQGGQY